MRTSMIRGLAALTAVWLAGGWTLHGQERAEITKAQLMCWRLGRMKEAGTMKHFHVSMAKRNSCWMALECCRLGRDILGANGITDEYQMMRHMCNLEAVNTYEGTHDVHALILGRAQTGIAAFN